MKWLVCALCLALLLTAGVAAADPITAIGIAVSIGTTIAGSAATAGLITATTAALIGGALAIGGALLSQIFQKQPASVQASVRGRSFETHPPYRIQIGEVPQEGNVVFQKVDDDYYYISLLISSIPIDGSDVKIWLNDIELALDGDINDMSIAGGAYPSTKPYDRTQGRVARDPSTVSDPKTYDPEIAVFWLGLGDQTQFPQDWIDYLEDDLPDIATASWEGTAVLHARFRFGESKFFQSRWGGRPIPPKIRIQCKGAKLYDPRLDSTSGVSGASGAHRLDDPDTWEYSHNPAVAWLNMALHEKVLARPQETILVQMVADAADDCDEVIADTGGETTAYSNGFDSGTIPARVAGTDPGSAVLTYFGGGAVLASSKIRLTGNTTISLYFDLVELGLDPSRTYELNGTGGLATNNGATLVREMTAQADAVGAVSTDTGASTTAQTIYGMPPDAKNVVLVGDSGLVTFASGSVDIGDVAVQGRYLSWSFQAQIGGGDWIDVGSLTITLTDKQTNEKFRCDGVLVVETREWDLLKPIEDSFAATRDSTGGLHGLRAGVYTAPSVTLSAPIAESLEYIGRTDPGVDKFIGVYLSRLQDYQEAETGSYSIRTGDRSQTIELPFVREQYQAERLVKIFAERERRNRSVTGLWSGLEYYRRIGEPVTFNSSPLPMMDGTFRVSGQRTMVEPVDGGVRFRNSLSLIEEAEAIYDYDHGTDFPNNDFVVYKPPQVVTLPGVPQNVTAVSGNDGAIATADPATSASDYQAGILLTWTAGTGSINEYEIGIAWHGPSFVSQTPEDADNTTTLDSGEGYARSISNLTVGALYTIRVRSVGPAGVSAWVTTTVTAAAPTDPIGDFDQADFDPADFV